ncbi:MAG: outer membrane protein transport protein [Rikenellaceae bacterium]
MKKLFFVASLLVASFAARAEGYQVNLQSARQTGMGHVGVALKLGSESMFFNPAGLSFMSSNIDLSFGGSAIFATATYSSGDTYAETDNTPSTPIFLQAAFKISDKLAAGLSVTTPYGSSLNWGKDWAGADLVQDIALKAYNIQPTISYRITDKLSIGGGLMINFGDVSISRALLPAGTLVPALGTDYADVIPVSATLTGSAGIKLGYNIGAMYDITDRLTLGASYRSKVGLDVTAGEATLSYASDAIKEVLSGSVPPLDNGTFAASMPMPANLTIGAAYKFGDNFLLSADIQSVYWSAYEQLDIVFSEEVLGGYNISSVKDYENTIIARIGGEYNVTDRFDVRAGVYYDQSPIHTDNYNPETPGMDKVGISGGFSFRPIEAMSIDFALLYIAGTGETGSVNYTNGLSVEQTFSGDYTSNAFVTSLGLSFRF